MWGNVNKNAKAINEANNDADIDHDNIEKAMADMHLEPCPRGIIHWDTELRKFVRGFRPDHEMFQWDDKKEAYLAYDKNEESSLLAKISSLKISSSSSSSSSKKTKNTREQEPPVFHYDAELRAFVQGMRLTHKMYWWDADYGYFTPRLTQRIIDGFNADNKDDDALERG